MFNLWRKLMNKPKDDKKDLGFDSFKVKKDSELKLEDVSILEFIVYDELKESQTDRDTKKD